MHSTYNSSEPRALLLVRGKLLHQSSSVEVFECLLILISICAFCAASVGGLSQLLLLPYFCCICIEALKLVNCQQVFTSLPALSGCLCLSGSRTLNE